MEHSITLCASRYPYNIIPYLYYCWSLLRYSLLECPLVWSLLMATLVSDYWAIIHIVCTSTNVILCYTGTLACIVFHMYNITLPLV